MLSQDAAVDDLDQAKLAAVQLAFAPAVAVCATLSAKMKEWMKPASKALERRDEVLADLASVDRRVASRAQPGHVDCGSGVLHRGGSWRSMKWGHTLLLELRRLRALLAAAVRSLRARYVVAGDTDALAEVAESIDLHTAPPPTSAFHLAIVTSPIVPAGPPRLGALV